MPASDFHDVSVGSSTGNPQYKATAGYDLVTGLGTPIANMVIADLIGKNDPNAATHFNISLPTIAVSGTAFSITVAALDASNTVSATYQGIVNRSH